MEGDRVHLHPSRDSLWLPTSPCPPSLQGGEELETLEMPLLAQAIVKGEMINEGDGEGEGEEELDVLSLTQRPTKKRRLTSKQLEFLESNFAVENKLEPERKLQLANELGLQPRQVAIWFQNRRARFKNKQLEKDYDSLKGSFEKLKSDFESLVKEKESLEFEVSSLKEKLASREIGVMILKEPLESSYYHDHHQSTIPMEKVGEKPCKLPVGIHNTQKQKQQQEDASSAKSDVFDSDSPLSFLGPDQSDQFSSQDDQDQEDHQPCRPFFLSSPSLLLPTKPCHDPSPDSCNYGFPLDDQPFWTWTSTSTCGGLYY